MSFSQCRSADFPCEGVCIFDANPFGVRMSNQLPVDGMQEGEFLHRARDPFDLR